MVEFPKMNIKRTYSIVQRHNISYSYFSYQQCNAVSAFIMGIIVSTQSDAGVAMQSPKCAIIQRTGFNSSVNGSQHSAKNSKTLKLDYLICRQLCNQPFGAANKTQDFIREQTI